MVDRQTIAEKPVGFIIKDERTFKWANDSRQRMVNRLYLREGQAKYYAKEWFGTEGRVYAVYLSRCLEIT